MEDVGWQLGLICLLTVVSTFFSVNGLSLRSYSRIKLQEAFEAANREHRTEAFVNRLEDYVLACSFFRILCNVGILMTLLMMFETGSRILPIAAGILILEIFSLAIPHPWAKYTGEKMLPYTYPILRVAAFLAIPALWIMRIHDDIIRRLAGVRNGDDDQTQEERQEEILSYVEQGRIEGVVDEEEMEMIEKVLELDNTTAEEIMTPRTDIIAVRIDEDLKSVLDTIATAGHSRIPVYEQNIDNIVGLLYAKDLLEEIGRTQEGFDISEKMRKPYYVPETKPLRALLHEFQNQKLHIAVVLDEYGGTAGIVTIEDILEELVGEITDEYEETPPDNIHILDETTADVDARMYIDDLNNEFDLDLPEDEDYDTIGGFVFSNLGYVPKTGETFEYESIGFTIMAAEERRIKYIRIKKPAPEAPQPKQEQ